MEPFVRRFLSFVSRALCLGYLHRQQARRRVQVPFCLEPNTHGTGDGTTDTLQSPPRVPPTRYPAPPQGNTRAQRPRQGPAYISQANAACIIVRRPLSAGQPASQPSKPRAAASRGSAPLPGGGCSHRRLIGRRRSCSAASQHWSTSSARPDAAAAHTHTHTTAQPSERGTEEGGRGREGP